MNKKRPTLEVTLRGGLGNQLFMLFGTVTMATQLNRVPRINLYDVDKNKSRHGSSVRAFNLESLETVQWVSKRSGVFLQMLDSKARSSGREFGLNGMLSSIDADTHLPYAALSEKLTSDARVLRVSSYFQTYILMKSLTEEFAADFFTINKPSKDFLVELDWIKSRKPIVLHLRRGDYLAHAKSFGVLDSGYYSRALHHAINSMGERSLYLVSDDTEEAFRLRSQIGGYDSQIRICPDEIPAEEALLLMRSAKALIMANSTFSWWAAFQSAPELVMAPQPWFRNDHSPPEILDPKWHKFSATWEDD